MALILVLVCSFVIPILVNSIFIALVCPYYIPRPVPLIEYVIAISPQEKNRDN